MTTKTLPPSLVPEHVHPLVKVALLPLTLPLAALILIVGPLVEIVTPLPERLWRWMGQLNRLMP
jgi:hypothetical protein